jgi:hypothetical protein
VPNKTNVFCVGQILHRKAMNPLKPLVV